MSLSECSLSCSATSFPQYSLASQLMEESPWFTKRACCLSQSGKCATHVPFAAHTTHVVPHPEQEALDVQFAASRPARLLHMHRLF